ncbi:MAG: hypothetical protein QW707_10005 [Candidatus Bathyarchaeia archaeon]
MSQIFLPFMDGCEDEIFSKLKKEVDEVCHQIAEKYNVFDSKGRPKKSFILDVLARNFCPYCIIKELTQMRRDEDVDAIYREGHNLTLNLLIEALRYGLNSSGVSAVVEAEVMRDLLVRLYLNLRSASVGLQSLLNPNVQLFSLSRIKSLVASIVNMIDYQVSRLEKILDEAYPKGWATPLPPIPVTYGFLLLQQTSPFENMEKIVKEQLISFLKTFKIKLIIRWKSSRN